MSVAVHSEFRFDDTFAQQLHGLYEPWQPAAVPAPGLLALNTALAVELGIDPEFLASEEGVAILAGNAVPDGATPLAQAYAGHQFGNYSPRLGDGRALLLGEVIDAGGARRDIHLKGSGRTPFARGGDGKAVVGPMLREYVIGEAMHALGIPATRALAVVATGEEVARETMLPGAVLTRVASSHLRVGTFQYAGATGDVELLGRLTDYAIARHHPAAAEAEIPALGLLDAVVTVQAELIARWMLVGFIHGVMNTDNMTISGETIDYGPCAFMDAFDPATVFSSIDHGGRYAYGNQPTIGQWNLARLAEALLPLVDPDVDAAVAAATEVLQRYSPRFNAAWSGGLRRKIGLADAPAEVADPLADELVETMREHRLDLTGTFLSLSGVLRGDDPHPVLADWTARWTAAIDNELTDTPAGTADQHRAELAVELDRVNPIYIPRNHLVDEALNAATAGDLSLFETLVEVVGDPFSGRDDSVRYTEAAPGEFADGFRTFCGT